MQQEETAQAFPEPKDFRIAQLVRAGILVAVGVAIAFTAPLHIDLGFDRWVVGLGLGLIGTATLLEYRAMQGTAESWWIAGRAVVAFAAAGSMLAVVDSFSFALVVVLWAVLTGIITLLRLVRKVQPPRVALPSMILSVVLAIAAVATREDQIAVIGFFGAYAIIRGVFLAIAALDTTAAATPSLTAAPDNE